MEQSVNVNLLDLGLNSGLNLNFISFSLMKPTSSFLHIRNAILILLQTIWKRKRRYRFATNTCSLFLFRCWKLQKLLSNRYLRSKDFVQKIFITSWLITVMQMNIYQESMGSAFQIENGCLVCVNDKSFYLR